MLVCNRCGKLIEEDELGYGYEPHGERTPDCCRCGGDYVEATECKVCGEWFEAVDGIKVCECCFEKEELVGTALDFGAENTKIVDGINGFITSVLSIDEINRILGKWVEENFIDHSKYVKDYCNKNKYDFAEFLIEKET